MNIPSWVLGTGSGIFLVASGGLTAFTVIDLLDSPEKPVAITETQVRTVGGGDADGPSGRPPGQGPGPPRGGH